MQCSRLLRLRFHSQRWSLAFSTTRGLLSPMSTGSRLAWRGPDSSRGDARRCLSLSSIPTVVLPPVVFTGLLLALWTYKCLMMIAFQNKIIYMPSMPPFSRSEKIQDYTSQCKPVQWTEHSIQSGDGTKLVLVEGSVPREAPLEAAQKHVVVVYFQGNASSLPPRLPYLSNILKALRQAENHVQYTVVALSYRGFWKSKGRPSQRGIELDAQAVLQWVSDQYANCTDTDVVLWGQSIGAGVATIATATSLRIDQNDDPSAHLSRLHKLPIAGLLLETPFTSLRAMVKALYPQKFLPYRYLGPFLLSTWDSDTALREIGTSLATQQQKLEDKPDGGPARSLKILLLEAGDDELVPPGDAGRLLEAGQCCKQIDVQHKVVAGALHTDVMMKSQGKQEIVRFLRSFEGVD